MALRLLLASSRSGASPAAAFGYNHIVRRTHAAAAAAGAARYDESPPPLPNVRPFEVTSSHAPAGDQPTAIRELVHNVRRGDKFSILKGATGTGKTFVMAHAIAKLNRPTLVLCHNKTLAAQLARELRAFLGNNAVELFVSYYDHYIPESYKEATGTYIAKKSSVNEEIDSLRHRATRALLERRDVVVVASVSCIYGLGLPREYLDASMAVRTGDGTTADDLVERLESMLYKAPENGEDVVRGNYVVSADGTSDDGSGGGGVVTLWPPHEKMPVRVAFGSGDCSGVTSIHQATEDGDLLKLNDLRIFPAKHHVTSQERLDDAIIKIEDELADRRDELNADGRHVEAQRLQQRVMNDLLMLRETGFCSGGENYSRHFAGREEGEPPDTLVNYFKLAAAAGGVGDEKDGDGESESESDWLLVVDESHVTLPQLRAMYAGDRARKERLVKHGYRLPSALDNRPLKDSEFWSEVSQAIFLSATPSKTELSWAEGRPVDMILRPTHVVDPVVHVRPKEGQLEHLLGEIQTRARRGERTLAVALTKRDAEDLASYLQERNVKADYIHSGLTTLERADALKALQGGDIDCLVGVNLLREGLDLPQVSLVAILNADSEGFLRCETSLLQTIGRAARNVNGEAVLYADRVTESMQRCMDETNARREKQLAHNERSGVQSRSTEGSNMLSIFDLLREEKTNDNSTGEESAQVRRGKRGSSRSRVEDHPSRQLVVAPSTTTTDNTERGKQIMTEHIPSKPGVYMWKDSLGNVLYIGKAKKLRSRVNSYLAPNAKHTLRIQNMLLKAAAVDFILTPGPRDALLLESNMVKTHQPPYNVLLKDDESYPYICASIGDKFPRFFAAPRKLETGIDGKVSKYRYFGPYPHINEINSVLTRIEETYDLRAKSFSARFGSGSEVEYKKVFDKVMQEVFEAKGDNFSSSSSLPSMRAEFEEASKLFAHEQNMSRDIVALERYPNDDSKAVVHVVQLRAGLVAGRFTYACSLPTRLVSEDYSAALQAVLERHYSFAESCPTGNSFFPDEILTQYTVAEKTPLKQSIRMARQISEPQRKGAFQFRTPNKRGPRKETDARAMQFAMDNAKQAALERSMKDEVGSAITSIDGTATDELATLLALEKAPQRIECYDVSHTQGDAAVASRVVFIGGKPAKHLYRTFNVKTVEGVDDYASLQEVLERRFKRSVTTDSDDDSWILPDLVVVDGGVGQLGAAIKGMRRGGVSPSTMVDGPIDDNCELDLDEMERMPNAAMGISTLNQTTSLTSVPVCALAKNKEEVFIHGSNHAVNDAQDTPALLLLRAIRDEAHRFALKNHRRRRSSGFR